MLLISGIIARGGGGGGGCVIRCGLLCVVIGGDELGEIIVLLL